MPPYTMDAFALLPTEVLPRLLMEPSCAAAMRITCQRYHDVIAPRLFKLVTQVFWASDYWEVHTEFSNNINLQCVQCGYAKGAANGANSTPARLDIERSTYMWVVECEKFFGFVNMGFEWGAIHIENPANIFHKVGRFSDGILDVEDVFKDIPKHSPKDFDACAQYRVDKTGPFTNVAGKFEVLSRLIDAAVDVILWRR